MREEPSHFRKEASCESHGKARGSERRRVKPPATAASGQPAANVDQDLKGILEASTGHVEFKTAGIIYLIMILNCVPHILNSRKLDN